MTLINRCFLLREIGKGKRCEWNKKKRTSCTRISAKRNDVKLKHLKHFAVLCSVLDGKKNALFISVVNFNPSSNESFRGSKERNKIPTRNLSVPMFKQSCLQSIRAIFAYVRLSQRDDDAHNICPFVWLTTTAILIFFLLLLLDLSWSGGGRIIF